LKKSPQKDLHRVAEHPADSAIRLLEQRSARRASNYPSEGEGKRIEFLRGLRDRRSSEEIALCVQRLCKERRSQESFEDSKGEAQEETTSFEYAVETQGRRAHR
jgi:hypothetical protein